jgi:flagellar protein FlaG
MQIRTVEQVPRQQLLEDVLALIGSRAALAQPAANTSAIATPEKAGPAQTEHAIREINQALKMLSTSLHFEVDKPSGKTLVKVIDRDSGEVLRQIPSEATVQIARSLDKLVGHLVNQSI